MGSLKTVLPLIAALTFSLLLSCGGSEKDSGMLDTLAQLKEEGNSHPREALQRLDSLRPMLADCDEHTRMLSALLEIRLHDKAFDVATDDSCIMELVRYFEASGTTAERQEAYYYAGSVYRDMEDIPHSLVYFLKSTDEPADSVLLINAYSQLHTLYYQVQNFPLSLEMAKRECEISEKTHRVNPISLMDLAFGEQYNERSTCKQQSLDNTLDLMKKEHSESRHVDLLYWLMNFYSGLGCLDRAKECLELIDSVDSERKIYVNYLTLGTYYFLSGDTAKATACFEKHMADTTDIAKQYNASNNLVQIYAMQGKDKDAIRCALKLAETGDSINFSERQQRAHLAHQNYQYEKELKQEARMERERKLFKNWMMAGGATALILLLGIGWAFSVYRMKKMEMLLQQEAKLKSLEGKAQQQKEEIEKMNLQLKAADTEIADQKQKLEKRIKQILHYIKLQNLQELDEQAGDLAELVRKGIEGHYQMTQKDWDSLYKAIERMHPDFKTEIAMEIGELTEKQKRICYLIRMGLSNPEISRMTESAPTTLWRWARKIHKELGILDFEDAPDGESIAED